MSKLDLITAEIVSNNLNALMQRYDLTATGVAAGANLEVHSVNRILSKTTNISTQSAKKLATFFGITIDKIFSESKIKFQNLDNTPTLKQFYEDNILNTTYFQSKAKENVVAHFLKTRLINDSILLEGKRASYITMHIKEKYKKDFDPKVVAKVLYRMSQVGLLEREDKTGKGSVYYYSIKS
jgi:transcriptional regulator with XRE-family HTH domain